MLYSEAFGISEVILFMNKLTWTLVSVLIINKYMLKQSSNKSDVNY